MPNHYHGMAQIGKREPKANQTLKRYSKRPLRMARDLRRVPGRALAGSLDVCAARDDNPRSALDLDPLSKH
jgi:hypothetical protein